MLYLKKKKIKKRKMPVEIIIKILIIWSTVYQNFEKNEKNAWRY